MLRTLLPLLLISACAARRSGDAVMGLEFAFEGEHAVSGLPRTFRRPTQRALTNAMAHASPTWQSRYIPGLVEPAWLDRPTLDTDAWRLEIWYANQGYFDARFLGWEVITRKKRRRMQPVFVRGHVDEGLPSVVRTIDVRGIEQLLAPLQGRIRGIVRGSTAEIAAGDVFALDDYRDALDGIEQVLHERSYAHARVTGAVAVHADEHQVDIAVDVVSGPYSKFGEITIEGLSNVPERLVRDQITFVQGDSYNALSIERTRAKLYALRVFGVVDVVPDLTDATSPVVPVHVRVTETKTRELRAGPVIEVESGKATAAAQATISDQNLFHRLWRVHQDTRVGVGVVANSFAELPELEWADAKPVVDLEGGVELPNLFVPRLSLVNEGKLEVGLETGYRFFSPSFSPTLVYTALERGMTTKRLHDLKLSIGYRIRYFDYFEQTIDTEAIEDSPLGLDLTDPYLLSLLEQRVVYDGRNDPIDTTRGWYASLAVAEAGGPFGGNFQFLRALGEVRAYRGIAAIGEWDPELVFAARLGGGVILPYGGGDEASVPYAERLYLGGSNTVRGWGDRRLGPYVCEPAEGDEPEDCDADLDRQIVAGGELQAYGSFEVRKGLPWGFTGALFVDAGRVWDDPGKFDVEEIQTAVGGGLRYATPIGPIRLDVGFRLGDPEYFAAQPGWAAHFSLAEAF